MSLWNYSAPKSWPSHISGPLAFWDGLPSICALCFSLNKSISYLSYLDFPGGSDGKASACNAGDPGSTPELGRFPWRRKWQPTPVLSPGKSHRQRRLVGYSPWVKKSRTWLSNFTFLSLSYLSLCLSLSSCCDEISRISNLPGMESRWIWRVTLIILLPENVYFQK